MKNFLLYFCLSFLIPTINAVANENSDNTIMLDKFFIDGTKAIFVVEFEPGDYLLKMNVVNPDDKATVEFGIEALTKGINHTPIKKQEKIDGKTNIIIGFSIREKADYLIFLHFIEGEGLNTAPYIETLNGKMKKKEPLDIVNVRLDYPDNLNPDQSYEWVYSELTVPEGCDALNSVYMPLCYQNTRLGVNRNPGDDSSLIFMVSDLRLEGSRTILLGRGEDVQVSDASDEKENHHLAILKCNKPGVFWKTDSPMCYLINRRELTENRVLFSSWFKYKTETEWTYLASWEVDARKENGTIYSYIKSKFPQAGLSLREGEFSNIYCKTSEGEWRELTEAQFSFEKSDGRTDYTAGIRESKPQKFFLASGGYNSMPSPSEHLQILPAKELPDVNVAVFRAFIDDILNNQKTSSWSNFQDRQIPVLSGEASESQRGEGIEMSFDGNRQTLYHSRWSGTKFPVTLTYHFSGKDTIDYVIYYPRTFGSNGNFEEFEVWTQSSGHSDYTKTGKYNFEGDGQPSFIYFPQQLNNVKSIRFVIKSGLGEQGSYFASCAEMEFYRKTGTSDRFISDVFTDLTCSELKPNITKKDIQAITNSNLRNIASALYHNTYKSEYRIQNYKPYMPPSVMAKKNKITPYSLLDNPTGIFVERDEDIVVFAGNMNGQRVSLRRLNQDMGSDYPLKEGLNVFRAEDDGLLYVSYHTTDPKAQPVKIHIASGKENGYYDLEKNPDADWSALLDSAVAPCIDVLGDYAHLIYAVDDFKQYTPDIKELIQIYDSIVWMEERFIGLEKYHKMNKNRMNFYLSNSPYYMFATTNRTGYSKGSMREICTPELLRTTAIWGPAHEVGHMNQTTGFKWTGMTEVSNNVYSMYIQQLFGNPSRLGTEKLKSDFDGTWFNRYEKGFTELLIGGHSQLHHGDVFCKLIPFWQLQLYNSDVKGYSDFYADLHEQIRIRPVPKTDGDALIQFMTLCCDLAKTDFTDFFIRWGMLIPVNETVTDHSSIQNQVYSQNKIIVSSKQVNNLIRHAKKYKKPEENIHYIHDTNKESVRLFKQKEKIKAGKIERKNNEITMTDWENVVVFEVFDGNKLIFATPAHSFEIPREIEKPVVRAIPAQGSPVLIEI